MLVALSLLLLALFGSSQGLVLSGGVSFQANANVTLANPDSRFDYRQVTFTEFAGVMVYTSIQATGQSSGSSASANANGIVGVAYSKTNGLISLIQAPPSLYLCFFNVSASLSGFGGNSMGADVSASLAFVAKVFHQLEEIDATTGASVKTIAFTDLGFGNGGVQTADASKGLYYITISSTSGGATIAITYAVSSVLGKLSNGGATITPTSIESFFEVDNYVYVNTANKLRLTLFIGHLSADGSVTGSTTIVSGTGPQQVYVRLDGTAIVNGNTQSVTIQGISNNNVDISQVPSSYLRGQLVGHGSLSADIRKVTVDFPAGATSFTYDPAIGFGAPNSGSFLAPSFFLLAIVAAILCFF